MCSLQSSEAHQRKSNKQLQKAWSSHCKLQFGEKEPVKDLTEENDRIHREDEEIDLQTISSKNHQKWYKFHLEIKITSKCTLVTGGIKYKQGI